MTCTSAQAFLRLLSDLDEQIAAASAAGGAAFAVQDVAAAQAAAARLAACHELQRQILTAQQCWLELMTPVEIDPPPGVITDRLELTPEQRAVAEKLATTEVWYFEADFIDDTDHTAPPTAGQRPAAPTSTSISGPLPRRIYYQPILRALVELGGRAPLESVIGLVGTAMAAQLGPEDLKPTAHTAEIRWRNSVRWARQDLVMRGFLLQHSPRRIWEISDAGRQWLAEQE